MTAAIELHHVTKRFGRRTAVEDLTLTVPIGEVFGLLGHNGAGKSTAIGMMLGQVWPTAGQVRIHGWDVATQRTRALARVGAIFETPAFYEYLSGLRNLEIFSSYTAPVSQRRLAEVLDWVGLTGREHSAVRTYSHGMRARLALAQALLPHPDLLILDEPGEGLDPEGVHELRQMLQRLHRELGLTLLISSHQLGEMEQLCTRIAVLRQGRKVFEGPWDRVQWAEGPIRLEARPFERAVAGLQAVGLVLEAGRDAEGGWVRPAPGITPDQLARWIVEAGFDLLELRRPRQTLEQFYLSLMRPDPQSDSRSDSREVTRRPAAT
ncbi:ABC transporter ATP-binding protein [Limisphaera sp. VF-2]|jgi:ABC-2 type transport system ATP-binding protein|uniref:ABC transporter ATP-binding protein n=1 Tax=Limisphaera sp. VF-2 TaxID=3400418 RepID=UPI00175D3CC7|nr:ABC transporter ATP-binding protein [Limisphaera sp.]